MSPDGFVRGNGLIAGNALVTGAAGFIGSHIVDRLLDRGWYVWGIDNFDAFYGRRIKESNLEEALPQSNFRLAEGDIRDDGLLAQVFREGQFDVVLHMAARAGVRPSIEAPD
ncbi:MAG TPA: GDP-mannose 4,6-dehydratase, partial [Actinomycetota bacterium]|nr:GDP-mannose 4,6-dehydratase [Actinomycetota bacterium]